MKDFTKVLRNCMTVTLLLLLSTSGKLRGQIQTPTIVPPSPTAQTIMRYGEIPVDYSTGVPSIQIPIYTVEGRTLKVPISISYHASGIKVSDIASEVGLGWALNAGGMVSRTINAIADETRTATRTFSSASELHDSVVAAAPTYSFPCNCYPNITGFEWYFNNLFPYEDPMTDKFFYKLPNGLSGVFTHEYSNNSNTPVILLPYRPLKIDKYISSGGPSAKIDSLKITDENGTVYLFQSFLTSWSYSYSEWYLRKMMTADGTDIINFFYSSQTGHSFSNTSHALTVHIADFGSNCSPGGSPYSNISSSVSPVMAFNTPVLDSIVSVKATVKFEYDDRDDFDELKRLTKITVVSTNLPSDTIRSVRLDHKYFGSTDENKRLGLDSVVISAPGDTQPQEYSFTYESQVLPSYPSKETYPTYSEDFWGYYNGANSPNLVPSVFASAANQSYCGNREPDTTGYFSKACMLKEIKYPAGGRTVFEFERNSAGGVYAYKSGNQGGCVGGFRIGSITNYTDSNNVAGVRTYEYGGALARPIIKDLFWYLLHTYEFQDYFDPVSGGTLTCWIHGMDSVLLSDPLLPLEVAPGMPVMYSTVIEYNGTKTANAGKTVYEYYPPYSSSDYLNNPEHPFEYESPWYYHPSHYDKGNYVPELATKKVYSFDGTNYHPVSKEAYEYSKLFDTTFQTGIKLTRTLINIDAGGNYGMTVTSDYIASVIAIDTKAYQEASLLTNSKSYVFDPSDSTKYVLTSADHTYNQNNLAIQETKALSSKADTLKTIYKYPIDFAGTAVYDTMVKRNILSPAIEQLSYENSDFLQSTKTNYDFWDGSAWSSGTNQILPRTVQTKSINQTAHKTRLRYHEYDTKSNILSVSKENDQKLSHIWDYNQTYPIAEVTNASVNNIAYTSFEADGKGSWTFSGSTTTHPSAPMGSKGYSLAGGNIVRSSLNSGITYIITYWKRDTTSSVTVNSGSGTLLATRNGWALYSHEITGTTTVTISGTAYIDEVRLYPKGSLMTTYAYKPLFGTTSQSDAANRIIYYEYDNFGRLKLIKDQDKNMLKVIDYQFKQSQNQ